jgi:Multisubunit Na+/H+ antiporter, MnhF subunit
MMTIALILIGLAALLTVFRLIKGPSLFDRLVASDTLSVIGAAFIVLIAEIVKTTSYVDVALVYGIAGFLGTVTIARFFLRVSK